MGEAEAVRGLVKICGLSDEGSVAACAAHGADLVGFVFVAASPRWVAPRRAGELANVAGGDCSLVGLFQNPALSDIEEVLEDVPLDMIQLHGNESDDDVARIGAGFGLPVIKAVGVASAGDLYGAAGCPADMMLFDAKAPAGTSAGGGHGTAFDWDVLSAAPKDRPWLLAGGLTPTNVAEAVSACAGLPGFRGVDVSSGVERSRGVKDERAIEAFIAAARGAMGAANLAMETHHA